MKGYLIVTIVTEEPTLGLKIMKLMLTVLQIKRLQLSWWKKRFPTNRCLPRKKSRMGVESLNLVKESKPEDEVWSNFGSQS